MSRTLRNVPNSDRTTMIRLLMGGVIALTLAGCETHRDRGVKIGEMVVTNAKGNHPIVVSKKMIQHQIPVRRGDYALSIEQRTMLGQFVDRYRREGEGKIVISAPAGQPNESAAFQVLNDVRDTMKSHGIVREMVRLDPYTPASDPEAPILVGFLGYEAKGPECGPLTHDMTGDRRNQPYEQLSCATQANTAAMIANPRDLVMAREETARPGERRDMLWGKYVKGESTETEKSKDQKSKLSSEAGTE